MSGSLAEVLRAAARALAVDLSASGSPDPDGHADAGDQFMVLPSASDVVVCLIDGLGWHQLREFGRDAPTLMQGPGGAISTVFPSTTAAALGSLGTGLLPGAHGLVGMAFRLPETGRVLHPLQWAADPLPSMVQPEPTIFELLVNLGVRVTTVAPGAYAASGLTRAVLRGPQYAAAEGIDERAHAVRGALRAKGSSLTYVYWPDLDRLGHQHGVGSPAWRTGLAQVDELVAALRSVLTPDALLLVTADHGMVTCPVEERIVIESHEALLADVMCIAGEPRARHVYAAPGRVEAVRRRWADVLGDRATVLSRQGLIDTGLLGIVEPGIDDRIGDLVVVPNGATMLASAVDPRASSLIGQHGGWSAEEVAIPLLRFTA